MRGITLGSTSEEPSRDGGSHASESRTRKAAGPKNPPKLMLQIGLVFGVCLAGQLASALMPIAVPGSVLSMLILFALLVLKVLKVDHLRQKADFLLQNMAFFFVPAGVGILANLGAVKGAALPLLAVILVTSVLTFGSAALTVKAVMAAQDGFRRSRAARMRRSRKAQADA